MSAPNEPAATLRFSCPACRAELAVPVALAGIEGPCPSCCHTIRAPLTQPVPPPVPVLTPLTPAAWQGSSDPILPGPLWPPAPGDASRQENCLASVPEAILSPPRPIQIPEPDRAQQVMQGGFTGSAQERNFRPRRAIPPPDEPPDDSWKDRHLKQQRSTRRVRRAEQAAHNLLHSRGFRVARVALILLSGAMLAFLLHYLKSHQWRFPGMSPAIADEPPRPPQGKVRPAGSDVNELMSDDDTEIPPASSTIPSPSDSAAIAAPPR